MSFVPIKLDDYVRLYLKENPREGEAELRAQLKAILELMEAGARCACGGKPWAIGSAASGLACFTCITGEATPTDDYELVEAFALNV